MRTLTVHLPFPPSVNNYTTVARGRKILSARGREYKRQAEFIPDIQFGKTPVSVMIDVFEPDKRRRDLDNLLKPILDVLVLSEVMDDDSQVGQIMITRSRSKNQKNGYVIVNVKEMV